MPAPGDDPVSLRDAPAPFAAGPATIVPGSGLAPPGRADGAREAVDCRAGLVCGAALLARSPPRADPLLLGLWSSNDAARAGPSASRTGARSDRQQGAQQSSWPRPAPDHQPQGPTAPGSALGSASSGGFQGGAVLGLIAALLTLSPLWGWRLVTPLERRLRLLLVSSLERPG
jgi:hypothetical protein